MPLPYRGPFLLLYAVDRQLGALLTSAFRDCPLTPDEFAVTSTLRLTGPVRAGELSRQTGHRPTSMSNYLRRFEERGLVRREVDPQDRRASLVTLTAEGVALTEACFPAFGRTIELFRGALADEGTSESDLLSSLEGASRALATAAAALQADPAGS
jgi:DNA-binding MarR family transcriptional regulator